MIEITVFTSLFDLYTKQSSFLLKQKVVFGAFTNAAMQWDGDIQSIFSQIVAYLTNKLWSSKSSSIQIYKLEMSRRKNREIVHKKFCSSISLMSLTAGLKYCMFAPNINASSSNKSDDNPVNYQI